MTEDQARTVATHMTKANYGSFACSIGCSYLLADTENRDRLLKAFIDLFSRIYADMAAYESFNNKRA